MIRNISLYYVAILQLFLVDLAYSKVEYSPLGLVNVIPADASDVIDQSDAKFCSLKIPKYVRCEPKYIIFNLGFYDEPEESMQPIGHIEIFLERKVSRAFFLIKDGPGDKEVKIHSVGEGHDTVSSIYFPRGEVKNNWVQLAKIPFEKPVWINLKKDWNSKPYIISPTEGVYVSSKYGSIVIKNITKETVEFRSEYPNDMPCDRDVDPKLKVPPIRKAPVTDFMDKNGHLNIYFKYSRGC